MISEDNNQSMQLQTRPANLKVQHLASSGQKPTRQMVLNESMSSSLVSGRASMGGTPYQQVFSTTGGNGNNQAPLSQRNIVRDTQFEEGTNFKTL